MDLVFKYRHGKNNYSVESIVKKIENHRYKVQYECTPVFCETTEIGVRHSFIINVGQDRYTLICSKSLREEDGYIERYSLEVKMPVEEVTKVIKVRPPKTLDFYGSEFLPVCEKVKTAQSERNVYEDILKYFDNLFDYLDEE